MVKTVFLTALSSASLVATNAVAANEPRMTLPQFLQQMQEDQASMEIPRELSAEKGGTIKNLEDVMSNVFQKGMLVNSIENARRLQARPITPEYLEPCFFEDDGCTTCWIDTYYQIAEWECPDFCGDGRDFNGHVGSNLDVVSGKYKRDAAECELLFCLPIEKGHCNGFDGNPFFADNDVPFEHLWTCQEQCFPGTMTEAPIEEWSLGFTALISLIGVILVVAIFFLLECLLCRSSNQTEIEGLVPADSQEDVAQISMKWADGKDVYLTEHDNDGSDEGEEGIFHT